MKKNQGRKSHVSVAINLSVERSKTKRGLGTQTPE